MGECLSVKAEKRGLSVTSVSGRGEGEREDCSGHSARGISNAQRQIERDRGLGSDG